MKQSVVFVFLFLAGVLVISSPMSAHHSNAVVDKDRLVASTGVVTRLAFVNPHVAIYWNVEDEEGNVTEWYASGADPVGLGRVGWNNKTWKPGDRILVQGHPLRDGRPLMAFRGLYRCSGEEVPTTPVLREYITRVKIEKLSPARVRELCAGAEHVGGN